ncbi:MAG: cell division protein FtsZ [Bacteroidales bacterium]|nr:cell division protein FtsZ [Bacteroidales bacterium]
MNGIELNNDDFIVPKDWNYNNHNKIKVIGVGGAGCNVVTHVFHKCVNKEVDFVLFNTDEQSLAISDVPTKIRLGHKGIGAGCDPAKAREAALETQDAIKEIFNDESELVFIAAGMGGGTGTGASPYIAKLAKEAGKVVVGVLTFPARDEGRAALRKASHGIEEMKKYLNSLLIVDNQKIYEIYGGDIFVEAFHKADDVMVSAVKSIIDIITTKGHINVDLADVRMVMENKGMAIMGIGEGEGEDRAVKAVEAAFASPLLNDSDLKTAKGAIVNITSSLEKGMTMTELAQIVEYVNSNTGNPEKFKRGIVIDPELAGKIRITVVATGFKLTNLPSFDNLDDEEDGNVVLSRNGIIESENYDASTSENPDSGMGQGDLVEYDPSMFYKENGKPALVLEPGEDRMTFEKESAYRRRQRIKQNSK